MSTANSEPKVLTRSGPEASITERLLMYSRLGKNNIEKVPTNGEKWWAAIAVGVLFALMSCTFMYSITNSLFSGLCISTFSGLTEYSVSVGPSILGLIIHSVIFTLIIRLLLN